MRLSSFILSIEVKADLSNELIFGWVSIYISRLEAFEEAHIGQQGKETLSKSVFLRISKIFTKSKSANMHVSHFKFLEIADVFV